MTISLISARNRVKQAEAVLAAWLESSRDDYEATLISAIDHSDRGCRRID